MRILLLLTWGALLMAAESATLRVAGSDGLIRADIPLRCTIVRARSDPRPGTLTVAALQGDRMLARIDLALTSCNLLRDPVSVVLGVPVTPQVTGPEPRLVATLAIAGVPPESDTRSLISPNTIRDRLARIDAAARAAKLSDPLPSLWLEQAAALALTPPTQHGERDLAAYLDALDDWLAGERPKPLPEATSLRAIRDPVDDSVQPYRLHLAGDGTGGPLVLLLASPVRAPRKEWWPTPAESAITAARAAGVTVVEAYPAGDLDWTGVAIRRAVVALTDAEKLLGRQPGSCGLTAIGAACQGALTLAETDPDRFPVLALWSPRWEPPPSSSGQQWLWMRRHGGLRAEHLVTTTIGVRDGEKVRPWIERLRDVGCIPDEQLADLGTPEAWRWIANACTTVRPVSNLPRTWIAWEPGPLGPFTVAALEPWATPATIRMIPGSPLRIETGGHAIVHLADPAPGLLVDGAPYRVPRPVPPGLKGLGRACGPTETVFDRPFTVVIGTGEHAAAADHNRLLAQSLLDAWLAYAQGAASWAFDTAVGGEGPPGRNLVCIGTPRSNSLLARLLAQGMALPVTWDTRSLSNGRDSWPRAEGRAVACCVPHPANDGRLVVVMDGDWHLPGGVNPLVGVPDLLVGASGEGLEPAVWRLTDSRWR